METWFLIVLSLCIAFLIKAIFNLISPSQKLPPGPPTLPFIGSLILFRKTFAELEPIIQDLHSKRGPLVALRLGSRPAVFVSTRSLAHQALIQNGAVFADRPPALPTLKILTADQHNINSAPYGPTWRALRRNLTAEILHPGRVRSYSRARKWVLAVLLDRLSSENRKAAQVVDHFQYAMFCLLVLMCFGDRLEEKQIRDIEKVQRALLLSGTRFNILNFWPRLGKILFRRRWEEFHQLRQSQADVLLPLIRARLEARGKATEAKDSGAGDADHVICYTDTLLNLQLPDEKRPLNEDEMLSLCSEFLNAGTDTTSTALQWIMANVVKYPAIQDKIYEEVKSVVGSNSVVEEDDLQKLPYVKAVVLEGLRRHPPGHFVLPHSVTEDTELGGYVVPKKGTVNFMVADMGRDPTVWEDPMAFKPERFLSGKENGEPDGFDITGSREIKMMPFGVGRRMCPGFNLALLHLEYFLANLVLAFEWKAVDGDDVDLSEKQEFTMVMKNPLKAIVSPRMKA